jgi:uncharacterized membrane protein
VTVVYDVLVILHFIGLASLLGGFLVQMRSTPRTVNNAMLHGALTQLVTGVLLVGLHYPVFDSGPDNAKITVKLLILLVVLGLILANRKKEQISSGVWGAIGLLTIANIAIAVLW